MEKHNDSLIDKYWAFCQKIFKHMLQQLWLLIRIVCLIADPKLKIFKTTRIFSTPSVNMLYYFFLHKSIWKIYILLVHFSNILSVEADCW